MTGAASQTPQVSLPGDGASLEKAKSLLARSRLLGRVSAFIFLLAALSVIDGLQTLVRHEFNSIDLIPGETVLVSGMLPADAKSHEDIVVKINGDSGLSFTPIETYKGFWMGGHMWRAELKADSGATPGKAHITVVDIIKEEADEADGKDARDRSILFGGRQNPALIHSITVWPTDAERRAADNSLIRRVTGIQPFVLAALCVALALAAALCNWHTFTKAEKALAEHQFFVVHGVKDMAVAAKQALPGQRLGAASGTRVAFFRLGASFDIGEPMVLLDRSFTEQAQGRLLDVEKNKAHALFPENGPQPCYGWLVARAGKQ